MRKSDVLRLKPGDTVLFADCQNTAKAEYEGRGRVLHVTPRGGVRVHITEGRRGGWEGPGTGPGAGMTVWVPYNWIIDRSKKAARDRSPDGEQASNNYVAPNEVSIFE